MKGTGAVFASLHIAIQEARDLAAGAGAVGVRAVGNALLLGPRLRLLVPIRAAGQIRVGLPVQHGPELGAGGGGIGREGVGAGAVQQAAGADEVDVLFRPVTRGVREVLGIIHDLDRGVAVHGKLDAVRRGQGILDDLLSAVRMDEDRHSAGLHVGNGDLDLGVAGVSGQLNLDGGGGAGIAGGLHLNRGRDRLAGLLRILNGLAAESGLCRGLTVFVGLDGAGGAVSSLVLGDGAAVGVGDGLDGGAVLVGGGLDLGAVGLGLGLNLGAVGPGGGAGAGGGLAGTAGTAATTTAGAAGAAADRTAGRAAAGAGLRCGLKFQFQLPARAADAFRIQCQISTLMRHGRQVLFC